MFAIKLDVNIYVHAIIIAPVNDTNLNGRGKREGMRRKRLAPALPKREGGLARDGFSRFSETKNLCWELWVNRVIAEFIDGFYCHKVKLEID